MYKFKVGDVVIVKSYDGEEDRYVGYVGKITNIYDTSYLYSINIDNIPMAFAAHEIGFITPLTNTPPDTQYINQIEEDLRKL